MTKRKMMFNYPFFSFKNRNYPYRYYNYPVYQNRYNKSYNNIPAESHNLRSVGLSRAPAPTHKFLENQQQINRTFQTLNDKSNSSQSGTSENRNSTKDEQFFSIFGIKLLFDDLIILALLFFLYNEGVKDEGLFLCLILLLLS